ncbi:hypothetical protein EV368DRAFT_80494 [Lentinula lateritia]|nr:hypothetical protein EV368DRAFT_80494 [Lentinula lateritia]
MLVFAATIPMTDAEVQSLDLPACSDDCMQFYLSEIGCTTDDPDCFCAESQFVSAILQCSAISCTEDDQETMDSDLNDLCEIDSNIPGGLSVTSLPLLTTIPATLPLPAAPSIPAIGPFSFSHPLASSVSASAGAGSLSTSPASASTTNNILPPLSLNSTSTTNTENSGTPAGHGSTTPPAASSTASSSAATPLFTSCNTAGVTGLVLMLGTMLELALNQPTNYPKTRKATASQNTGRRDITVSSSQVPSSAQRGRASQRNEPPRSAHIPSTEEAPSRLSEGGTTNLPTSVGTGGPTLVFAPGQIDPMMLAPSMQGFPLPTGTNPERPSTPLRIHHVSDSVTYFATPSSHHSGSYTGALPVDEPHTVEEAYRYLQMDLEAVRILPVEKWASCCLNIDINKGRKKLLSEVEKKLFVSI